MHWCIKGFLKQVCNKTRCNVFRHTLCTLVDASQVVISGCILQAGRHSLIRSSNIPYLYFQIYMITLQKNIQVKKKYYTSIKLALCNETLYTKFPFSYVIIVILCKEHSGTSDASLPLLLLQWRCQWIWTKWL